MRWSVLAAAAAAHSQGMTQVRGRVGWYCERCNVSWSASVEEPCWCCGHNDARVLYADHVKAKHELERQAQVGTPDASTVVSFD